MGKGMTAVMAALLAMGAGWAQFGGIADPTLAGADAASVTATTHPYSLGTGPAYSLVPTGNLDMGALAQAMGIRTMSVYGSATAPTGPIRVPYNNATTGSAANLWGGWQWIPGQGYYHQASGQWYFPEAGTYDPSQAWYYQQEAQAYQNPSGYYWYSGDPSAPPYGGNPPAPSWYYQQPYYPQPYTAPVQYPYSPYQAPQNPYGYAPSAYVPTTGYYDGTGATGGTLYYDYASGQWRYR